MIFNQRKMHHINRFVYKPKRHEIVYMQQNIRANFISVVRTNIAH